MAMLKKYIDNLVCACADEQFGQEAVQHAIDMGHVKLAYRLEADVQTIMSQYDAICDAYRKQVNQHEAMLMASYGPLLDEVRRAA